jgi:hypothetical protein
MARRGHHRLSSARVRAVALALLLAGCGSGSDLVPGICRSGPQDAAGNAQQVCTARGSGDPVRIVLDPAGSWPEFDGGASGRAALNAASRTLDLAPPQFDPRRDQVLWPARGRSPVIVTFAVSGPAPGGAVSTLRVMFRPEDGEILGYRRVPRR